MIVAAVAGILAAANAGAAHPSLEACGGMKANRQEGVRSERVIPDSFERRIEAFLREADVAPGVAVAIVKDDRIVYARGFGFRELGDCLRVASDSRFYLKSTTKSFLGMAAAVLHEEGAIDLDAPISDYLPELAPRGVNARQISLRSHFLHTQPYYSADFDYRTSSPGNLPEAEYVRFVNEFSEARGISSEYHNFGPIMAAHALSAKSGIGWRDLLERRLFVAAGMRSTFASMARAEDGPMAQAYGGAELADFVPLATKADPQMHPAGGSVSSVADLGRWIVLNLNGGRIDAAQALPRRAVEQAQARQAQVRWRFSEFDRFAVGLGLYAADYEGDVMLHHFGGETHMSFMPERRIGVAVLTNEIDSGILLTHRLAATIYDALLGKDDLDARIVRRLREIADGKGREVEGVAEHMEELRAAAPSGQQTVAAEDLIGRYVEPGLGEIVLRAEGTQIVMDYGVLSGPLAHVRADAWLAEFQMWGAPPELFVFRRDERGSVLDWDGRIFVKR
jgi:CubicO group peptidase (beta-lactamase class C family)